jgi:hypothetical protein
MAEYRPALTPAGRHGQEAEIFLYDTLPGGAGFSSQLVDHGKELFQRALRLMKTCPENCDASCYRCLRSFKNKFEHSLLDRHVGSDLVEYLLTDKRPLFDARRLASSTGLLFSDLQRMGQSDLSYQNGVTIHVTGLGEIEVPILATRKGGAKFAIDVSGPLTNDLPVHPDIRKLRDADGEIGVIVVNELLVRGNLPAATREVQARLKG